MKTFVLTLIVASVLLFASFAYGGCQSSVGGHCVELAAILPGLEFLGDLGAQLDLGELLVRLYIFGVGFTALAAFVWFTAGGVIYLTAGDNEGRVTQAKGMIGNAIFGLALALLSWLILFTINPDLVRRLEFRLPILPAEPVSRSGGTTAPAFGSSQVGSQQPVTGVGIATVSSRIDNVDVCTQQGQTQRAQFCNNCINSGGVNCQRASNVPISQCLQSFICLRR